MDSQTTISVTEARKKIFQIINNVNQGARYTITEKGRAKAVVLSADEFDSWLETIAVMREFPDLKKDIEETKKDIKSGKYRNYITLEKLLAQEQNASIKAKNKSKKAA